ncbi:serine/threonine-protein kinase [Streptomyces ipomoeae]|uniref:serine/threonine-protein kinase n=1 Tax=Streptomyces ipomoeae TaxID=103232 RepID=UPI00215D035E|nr:serine/threonine-protein kinase [Streptomyces ipomoeae]
MVTGRYRLVESIGQGGMGRVWRATDEILDRQVAVKEMRIDGLDPEDTRTRRERTLREARASARIDHPGVVRVYDVVDEGERLWIVMELIDGRSLERLLVDDGPLDVRETARIGLELVDALGQVHAQGVLHRDIKPANVLVRRSGTHRVVLTDFGIAAIQDAEALTMVGMLVGSPDYMAPERVSGRPQGPPSDLWSLGATLCAALGGRSPFSRSTTLATLHAVLYEEPELPPTAGELHDLLAALLKKDPEARPGLRELTEALRTIATGPIGGAVAAPVEPEPSGAGEEPDSGEAEIAGQAAETAGAGEPEASSAPHRNPWQRHRNPHRVPHLRRDPPRTADPDATQPSRAAVGPPLGTGRPPIRTGTRARGDPRTQPRALNPPTRPPHHPRPQPHTRRPTPLERLLRSPTHHRHPRTPLGRCAGDTERLEERYPGGAPGAEPGRGRRPSRPGRPSRSGRSAHPDRSAHSALTGGTRGRPPADAAPSHPHATGRAAGPGGRGRIGRVGQVVAGQASYGAHHGRRSGRGRGGRRGRRAGTRRITRRQGRGVTLDIPVELGPHGRRHLAPAQLSTQPSARLP